MPEKLDHISDQELLERYRSTNDNQLLGVLLERYTMLLFGVCMKYMKNIEEARDCVQQVFLKVITELQKYPVQYFKSWLYIIARNHCLMRLREKQGTIPTELAEDQIADESDLAGSLQQHLEKNRKLELLTESLEELSQEQKQCVTLFYLEKKSYHEIAAETGYSIMQVKSYIQNGKRNLKQMLQRKSANP